MADELLEEKEIFNRARQIAAPADRLAYLQEACGQDPAAMHRLLELLRVYEEERSFLEASPVAHMTTIDAPIAECPGTLIGPYKLLEQIGEGGFGVVFMAEQTEPVRRKVALKVVKPGMDTRQVVARFEAERQALAIMDHPNIAKVHDGGETASGRPYFVMELVKGVPITDYCDENQLTPRERLELFLHVCWAVQHAHQKGIIHRDIKPSNVLAASHDGVPVVKIIDFGVAKAVGQQLTERTLYTQFAQFIGTPLYMSPEQAGQSSVDVDTRSDIYSLGVLLYELLTGTTPFDSERLKTAGLDEIRRIIREEEPLKPSTRIRKGEGGRKKDEANRESRSGFWPFSSFILHPSSFQELDWIVMKALEKDRNRRYETANGLARDVERYLHDEPVLACPPSAWYRFRKFTRRNKSKLVVTAGVFLSLAGIAGGIGWGVRDRAARRTLDQAVDRTLNEAGPLIKQERWQDALGAVERADQLLAAAGRTKRPPRLLELRTDLSMAERLERIYQRPQPELPVLASSEGGTGPTFQERRGSSEQDFFMGRQADAEYARAFRDFGIDIDALAPAEAAAQISRRGIFPALVKALDEWGPLRLRARGPDDPGWKTLVTIARLADPDLWRNRCREALLRRDRTAMEELADTVPIDQVPVRTLWLLGMTLRDGGAPDKAVSLLLRAQHQYPSDLWINDALGDLSWGAFRPPRTDDALRFYSIALALRPTRPQLHLMVGIILQHKKDVEGAIREYQAALRIDPDDTGAHVNLGLALGDKKDVEGAIREFQAALRINRNDAWAHVNLGLALRDKKDFEGAIREYQAALKIDPNLAMAHYNLGLALRDKKDVEGAIREYQAALRIDPDDTGAHVNLGLALRDKKDVEGAIREFQAAFRINPNHAVAHNNLGLALGDKKDFEGAIREFQAALKIDPNLAMAHYNLGLALRDKKDVEGAIREFQAVLRINPNDARTHDDLGSAYTNLEQWDKALAVYTKAIELDPKQAVHYNRLAWLLATVPDPKVRDPKRAVELAQKAVALEPNDGNLWNTLGAADYRAGSWQAAIEALSRSTKIQGENAFDSFFLAMAYWRLGNKDEARRRYDSAVQWMDKNQPKDDELIRFRTEAAELLKINRGQ